MCPVCSKPTEGNRCCSTSCFTKAVNQLKTWWEVNNNEQDLLIAIERLTQIRKVRKLCQNGKT